MKTDWNGGDLRDTLKHDIETLDVALLHLDQAMERLEALKGKTCARARRKLNAVAFDVSEMLDAARTRLASPLLPK